MHVPIYKFSKVCVQLQVNFFSFDNKIQLIEMPIVFHMKVNLKKRLADPPPTHPNFLKKD